MKIHSFPEFNCGGSIGSLCLGDRANYIGLVQDAVGGGGRLLGSTDFTNFDITTQHSQSQKHSSTQTSTTGTSWANRNNTSLLIPYVKQLQWIQFRQYTTGECQVGACREAGRTPP